MMKKDRVQTTLFLRDDLVAYVSVAKDAEGFFISDYDRAELEPGVIERGEILKADFLQKILFKIRKKIGTKDIHLILPHEHFGFDTHSFKRESKKDVSKQVQNYLKKNKSKISWAKTHGYEYDVLFDEKNIRLLFRTLPHEMHETYRYLFEKAGFHILSIQSQHLALRTLLPQKGFVSQLSVGVEKSYLINYKDGLYQDEKVFDFSYQGLLSSIQKYVSVSQTEAESILQKYGVLQIHPEPKVYSALQRKLDPILSLLKKKKKKDQRQLFVHEINFQIPGLSLLLGRVLPFSVREFSFHENPEYPFHEVLSLHKKESYFYEPLIAHSLSFFEKKK